MHKKLRNLFSLYLIVSLFSLLAITSFAADTCVWEVVNVLERQDLNSVTYGNGKFVAVGDNYHDYTSQSYKPTILTSVEGTSWTAGISWTAASSGTYRSFYGVTYGNNRFVAVGDLETIVTSGDGTSWTVASITNKAYSLYGVTYDNNRFVAVGSSDSGRIVTSVDGTSWTAASSGNYRSLYGVTYGNKRFVAVGSSGTIVTSVDGGASWTGVYSGGTSKDFNDVTYGNNRFVAVGDYYYDSASQSYKPTILTSSNGISWTAASAGTSASSGITSRLNSVSYGNNRFVAVGDSGQILMSVDGISWTDASSGTYNNLNGVTYANNRFVAVGRNGIIVTSKCDGTQSTTQQLTVSKAGTGSGTITSSPAGIDCGSQCSKSFNNGEFLMLTATPSAGSTFVGWSGGVCSGSLTTCNLTMDAAKSVTAIFNTSASTAYQLTVSKAGTGSGTITSSPAGIDCGYQCSTLFNSGTSVMLTAASAAGSTFAGWSGGVCSGTTTTCTVTMDAAQAVTATFNQDNTSNSYTVIITKSGTGNGTITSSPAGINCGSQCSASFNSDTRVTVYPVPDAGSTFAGWSNGGNWVCSDTPRICSINATFNKSITTQQLTVSKTGTGNGTITSSPDGIDCGSQCSASFNSGIGVILTATSATGSTFAGWSGGVCSGTTATCT